MNNLDVNIRRSFSINVFKKELLTLKLKFIEIKVELNFTYNIHDTKGIKLLTRSRFGLSKFTNSDTTFKTVYVLCVLMVRVLKQQPNSPFIAPIIIVQENSLSQHKSNK